MNELAAIIVAAGKSQRMGGVDKQMRTIGGVPVLARTIAAFEACEDVGAIVLVLNPDNMAAASTMGQEYGWSKARAIVAGGERRQDSRPGRACSRGAAGATRYPFRMGGRPRRGAPTGHTQPDKPRFAGGTRSRSGHRGYTRHRDGQDG